MIGDMYGDFSRLTFAPEKHFSAVLVQQGRVMLDSDANEQTAVLLHHFRRLAADLIGPYGGPDGANGFAVSLDTSTTPPTLAIAKGRYYVHGLLCEADTATTYFEQPDAFLDPELDDDELPAAPYIVYLKVWERHITALEDPSIRELALGENGPDTAARSKIVWQVKASATWPPGGPPVGTALEDARTVWTDWEATQVEGSTTLDGSQTPALRARARRPGPGDFDPCIVSPDARYRGLENQLYRVEIHDGGSADTATFKWSRDNGAAVFALESLSGAEAEVVSLGRDRSLGLEVEDWVEVLDDRSVLRGERHPLIQVVAIDPLDRLVMLARAPEGEVVGDPTLHPLLRRWDQRTDDGLVHVAEGTWVPLEDGIEVQFDPGAEYTAGDCWLIPARTATRDVDWPQEAGGPAPRRPSGVRTFYAPLAFVDDGSNVSDMRSVFSSLAQPVV